VEHVSLANLANTKISKVLLYVRIANLASTPTQSVQQQTPHVKLALLAPVRKKAVMTEQTVCAKLGELALMEGCVLPVILANTRVMLALPSAQRAKRRAPRQLEAQPSLIAQQ